MYGVGIAPQHFGPAPPCRTVAFVDDDDAESVLAVVLGQEAGKACFVVQAEGLVGGDVDAGIGGGVAAFLGPDDAGVVADGDGVPPLTASKKS